MRLISATNADLNAEVAAGRFRQDLLFRLNTIEIHLPPLRDRREDIPLLAQALPAPARAALPQARSSASTPAAMQQLLDHRWPGNVRELDHAVERAVLMSRAAARFARGSRPARRRRRRRALEDMSLEDVEAFLIKKAMARFDGNVSQAAEALGLSAARLYRRLERYAYLRRRGPPTVRNQCRGLGLRTPARCFPAARTV